MKYIPVQIFNKKKDEGDLSITLCQRGDLRVVVKAARAGSSNEESLLREAQNNLRLPLTQYTVLMTKMVEAYENMPPLVHHTLDPTDIMDTFSYLVFPYSPGSMSLLDFLVYLIGNKIDMPVEAQNSIVLQLIELVEYLHGAGFAHNDIKPDNVLVTVNPEDGSIRLKLIDLADMTPLDNIGRSSPGTTEFMAPERLRKREHGAEKTDIFSLGAVILTLLYLEFPFGGGSSCYNSASYLRYAREMSAKGSCDQSVFLSRFTMNSSFVRPS